MPQRRARLKDTPLERTAAPTRTVRLRAPGTPARTDRGWNSTLPASRKPLKARKVSKRFAGRRDPGYCRWIRTEWACFADPCGFHGDGRTKCAGPIECAHVVSRGAGGDDQGNTVPLCRRHHHEQHSAGIQTFQARYHLDMASFAAGLLALYRREAA